MTNYIDEVKNQKKYIGNVVIRFAGTYFAIRKPDSGLDIPSPFSSCIGSLVLNPTTVDLRRVTTTIASYSFKLVDKSGIITAMVKGDAASLVNTPVEIWLGRSDADMPFSNYYKLPDTRITKADHADNSYSISTTEETDRMQSPTFDLKSALAVDILAATTVWTMRDSIANFPATGFLKVDNEFVSYSGIDLVNNRFTGVVRGELGSTPDAHDANTDVFQSQTVTGNPLTILLQLLTSNGGGGIYDVLADGLGISESLIDVAGIEELRDNLFASVQYTLSFYNISSTLKIIENEILAPNNLRFTTSLDSKISIVVLDKAVFVDQSETIDEDTITKFPKWTVDGAKIVNAIEVQWDYDETSNQYKKRSLFEDSDSITKYGRKAAITYAFKGIKAALDGETIVTEFANGLLGRLSLPTPEVSINTQIDKSLQTIGDKTVVESSQIPSGNGTLNFASEMEIVSRSINMTNGDVQFKLAFTSFTNIRSCYISPCSTLMTVVSQKKFTVPAGRGDLYTVGWKLRLWDSVAKAYAPDPVNTLESINGDELTFANSFTTVVTPENFKIKFADYDDVVTSQKRYCFISNEGLNFNDGKPTYRITY